MKNTIRKLIPIFGLSLALVTIQCFFNGASALQVVADFEARINTLNTYLETAKILKKQKEQLELEIQNAKTLTDYDWSNADQTISDLLETIDTLSAYNEQYGGLEHYLELFQDIEHYQSSPCFSTGGCSKEEMDTLQTNQVTGSSAQKEANDAMIHGLALQQSHLQSEAETLESLQAKATTAEGHMAAIQYANQLASRQAHQLMQIRGLLIAEQTAAASRAQVIADHEAQQYAAAVQLRKGTYYDSPKRNWLGVIP